LRRAGVQWLMIAGTILNDDASNAPFFQPLTFDLMLRSNEMIIKSLKLKH
jgi:hypothetical protein